MLSTVVDQDPASDVVYAEAKGEGYDAKVLRKIVSLRKKDPAQRTRGGGAA